MGVSRHLDWSLNIGPVCTFQVNEYIDKCLLPWKQGAEQTETVTKDCFLSLKFAFELGQMEDEEWGLGCFPSRGDNDSKSAGFWKREFKKAHLLQ